MEPSSTKPEAAEAEAKPGQEPEAAVAEPTAPAAEKKEEPSGAGDSRRIGKGALPVDAVGSGLPLDWDWYESTAENLSCCWKFAAIAE